jgi:hypothetical protein
MGSFICFHFTLQDMQFKQLVSIVVGIGGFLAAGAAVFGIIQGVRESRPPIPKLQAAVVNVEHVSSRTEIPDVKISLAFEDQSVSDLWLCRVRFQNIGGITLYTTGSRPNTQSPLVISVPEKYEILKIEPKGIDPKDSGFEAQVRQKKDDHGVLDKHQFEVTFEQWRKGEAIEAVLYLAGSGEHLDTPKLIPKGRPILDGDVVPVDLSTVASAEVKGHSGLDKITNPFWASILRLFAVLSITVVVMSLIAKETLKRILGEDWVQRHPIPGMILKLILVLGLYTALIAIKP